MIMNDPLCEIMHGRSVLLYNRERPGYGLAPQRLLSLLKLVFLVASMKHASDGAVHRAVEGSQQLLYR